MKSRSQVENQPCQKCFDNLLDQYFVYKNKVLFLDCLETKVDKFTRS